MATFQDIQFFKHSRARVHPRRGPAAPHIGSFCALALLWLAATPSVRAQADGGDDPVMESAQAEFEAGRFLEARALYMEAQRRRPTARGQFGLGRSACAAKLYSACIAELNAALEMRERPLSGALRREAQDYLTEARPNVGSYTLELDPPNAQLQVDGSPAVFDRDGSLLLDAGVRRLTVQARNRVERETRLEVEGGNQGRLALEASLAVQQGEDRDLLAEAAREEPTPQGPESSLLQTEPVPEPPKLEQPFPWLAMGAFGLAAGSAVLAIVQFERRDSHITAWKLSDCSSLQGNTACANLRSGWQGATTWGFVSLGLTGAFTATGVLLLVLQPEREPEPQRSGDIACSPLAPGLSCVLRL